MIKSEVAGLRSLEDGPLEIGREESEAQQPPTILGFGRLLTDRQFALIELQHRVGALERSDENRIARVEASGRQSNIGASPAIAYAYRSDEPDLLWICKIVLGSIIVR